ncbi:hypothetical protein O181_000242 [Austropuccinia psidii MF-1]|uniref:Uncharacterized protein n=1 Tax=Austropuccinia psidii MF-1 TaxID=1389203 RepID=A0A9Q3GBV2_9BASI|nr:hypothetical protein [Austropuccinia psidii MF-1]
MYTLDFLVSCVLVGLRFHTLTPDSGCENNCHIISPFQHSHNERQTRPRARAQAVLTPTPRVPLEGTPEASQQRAHIDRGPFKEGVAPSRKEGMGPRSSNQSF